MSTGYTFGHETYCIEPEDNFSFGDWKFKDNDELVDGHNRKCPTCEKRESKNGHDPCIKNLPGVRFACCGHGVHEGYIMFENGTLIRGMFKIEHGY